MTIALWFFLGSLAGFFVGVFIAALCRAGKTVGPEVKNNPEEGLHPDF